MASERPSKPGMSGTRDPNLTWMPKPVASLDLSAKKTLVVGGTNGLGRAIARLLASRGAEVTVVGQTFRDEGTPHITFSKADLSRMSEARRVGATLPVEALDVVLFTTGIIAGPSRQVTEDNIERDMAISYLSRLVALREMAPRLLQSRVSETTKPRVFVMGFPGTGEPASLAISTRSAATRAGKST